MNSTLTSLAIAAAVAVLLVVFKLSFTGTDFSSAGDPPADSAGTHEVSQTSEQAPRIVDQVARKALERAIRDVEDAEASYARIEREMQTLEAEMGMLDPDADEFVTETFVVQAEPLLDQLIAAEEALQQAKHVERAARAAVEDSP